MSKRTSKKPAVVTTVSEVVAIPAKSKRTNVPENAQWHATDKKPNLRADYVVKAWEATQKILPATYAQIAALPEFQPELLKGGAVVGYLGYWTRRGYLTQK